MLEPQQDLSVLIPKTLHSGGVKPKVCMLNLTDSTIRLKQHQLVAYTYPVCSIYPVPVDNTGELLESLNPDVINLVKNIKTGVNISPAPNSNCPQTVGTNYKTCSSDVVVEQVDSEKMSPKTIDQQSYIQGTSGTRESSLKEVPAHVQNLSHVQVNSWILLNKTS